MSRPSPFSLLLPVYGGDSPEHLQRAFTSAVDDQTLPPDEVVVVQDGPLPRDLKEMVDRLVSASSRPTQLIVLPDNVGLADALTRGLRECAHEIVARMDADDIALPSRFERQLARLEEDSLDLVGAGMFEFLDENGTVLGRRTPPVGSARIRSYARFHDPFNHPTVVYRKAAVLRAGGYRSLGLMEDYWLFARMIHTGARVDNIPEPLVMYRVGAGAYTRRGGWAQLRAELRLQREFRRSGFTTRRQYLRNVLIRASYRLVPVGVRKVAYRAVIARGFRRGAS